MSKTDKVVDKILGKKTAEPNIPELGKWKASTKPCKYCGESTGLMETKVKGKKSKWGCNSCGE